MPFCLVRNLGSEEHVQNGGDVSGRVPHVVEIFYQLYGHGDTKVLLIPGVAANYEAWGPQLVELCGTDVPNQEEGVGNGNGSQRGGHGYEEYGKEEVGVSGNGIQACAFDNRGVGRSSMPEDKKQYSTTVMARDALALMDHLGWERAHIVGHSMGGMIACKLASIAPERVISLAMLSTTGGGYQCLPKFDRTMIKIAYRFMRAKTPEERAHVDLDTHYTKDYLDTLVGEEYRRAILYKDYVKNLSNSGMQPKHGLDGQFHACWTHGVSSRELDRIRNAGVRVVVIHGTGDIVAQVRHARKIAEKLHPVSRMVELPGGHMITHQHTKEVNEVLLAAIKDELPSHRYSEWGDEPLRGKGWNIWQRGEAEDGKVTSVLGSRCVGSVVRILIRYWPQCLSLKYAFPSFYWFLNWFLKYFYS
ncbi:hypothetical protein M758_4G010700 [Ceratodon purpureus]|nr:hypothetical protein M758_4G010700 [Ceratodon purpureus]